MTSGVEGAVARAARRYRVVTAEVGAVVLETDQQYAQNGLDSPLEQKSAHGTPEPATWLLMASALAVLRWWQRLRSAPNAKTARRQSA